MQFANRLNQVETSAIRALFKALNNPDIISFAGGIPDAKLFDVEGMQLAAQQALSTYPEHALQYSATEGFLPFKQQIIQMLGNANILLQPEQFTVTTGSQQALDLLGKCMLSSGDKVIVEAPTFLAAIQCFRLYGAEVISAPIDANGVQPDALEQLIVRHRPKMVYLIPTFSNPSGATLSLQRRKRVLELAAQYKTLVVEDDPYGALYFDVAPPPSLLQLSSQVPNSAQWLAHCGSISKTVCPGFRLGWLVAPSELLANAVMCKQFSDANTSTFAQATAAVYLTMQRLPQHVEKVRKVYASRAQCMADNLQQQLGDSVQYTQPQGGMFFWVRLTGAHSKNTDATSYSQRAIENKVAFVPGRAFFAQHPDNAYFRLSFATVDTQKIQQGIVRMAQAL